MALFIMECPHCRQLVEADDTHLNESAVCPYCQKALLIRKPRRVKPFYDDGRFPEADLPEGSAAPGAWIIR